MKSVFDYLDYREFLRDWCDAAKAGDSKFSMRNFARRAELGSISHLRMVMKGERGLTADSAEKFARAIDLNDDERLFFGDLVEFNQAGSEADRERLYKALFRHEGFRAAHEMTGEHFECLTKWYYVAIREMIALPDFKEDPEWIAANLRPAITPDQAREAIDTLVRCGFASRDDEGRLFLSQGHLATPDEVAALVAAGFHRSMIERAGEAVDEHEGHERSITSLTAALSKERFLEMKRRINEFRKELRAFMVDCEDADEVYQINFQLFSLTGVSDEA